jgi:hypothetical protein
MPYSGSTQNLAVTVLYFDSDKAPCACVADGIMIATVASPGQRTLQIAQEKALAGAVRALSPFLRPGLRSR